jgi:hypothetical protein
MSLHIHIRTDKSLQQLAIEIRELLSLPPFKLNSSSEEHYCQFEMLGMVILLHTPEIEEHDPEVKDFPYAFDLQMSFEDLELDIDTLAYTLQPYYAQLLAFRLDVETACFEKKKVGPHWQIRYCFYRRNPRWNENILYGEPSWEPAVQVSIPGTWRTVHHRF